MIPYKTDTDISSYIIFPRFLIPLDLSNDAKVLYALLLDRAGISRKKGYIEADGTIRLYFTVEDAKAKLRRSRQVATRVYPSWVSEMCRRPANSSRSVAD